GRFFVSNCHFCLLLSPIRQAPRQEQSKQIGRSLGLSMRRWIALGIGGVISIVFIVIGLQGLNLAEVWDQITHANFVWLVPGVAVYFLAVWGRTWRWHYLLRPMKAISLRALFPIVVIGYMGNNVYPF